MKPTFVEFSKPILERMAYLEERDASDRKDGTPHLKRLRQIPPQTGMLLALLAASAPHGPVVEIGTSGGYSSLWLAQACRQRGDKLTTYELLPEKVDLARETFAEAHIEDRVDLVHGDARSKLRDYEEIAFCFLDAEKEMYAEFYDLVVPRLLPGGILVVDNVISHQADLQSFVDKARKDKAIDALVLRVGLGLLVCIKLDRRWPNR
ncbi:MAG TPA: class I SAM-dependent methyltransferase [Anaerolineales bacterium]|nr:class I SAM-dependent methyltransferase [Anaerolineales bacterium]